MHVSKEHLDIVLVPEQCVCTEASTIGVPPGVWPQELTTDLGAGDNFRLRGFEGDTAIYAQLDGFVLYVLND